MKLLKRRIRIFLSSPGDVSQERKLALDVIDQLPYTTALRDKITVEVVAWDKPGASTPMLATIAPQEAINEGLHKPSECDIVIVILWSRMGTPLPAQYVKSDGSRYISGTEWEYWDAFNASKNHGKPYLVVYRRMESVNVDLNDPDFVEKGQQWFSVKKFFESFINPDGSLERGYNQYHKPEDFRRDLETHLTALIERYLNEFPPEADEDETSDTQDLKIWHESPFPGLKALTPKDAPIFFGRGRETDTLVNRIAESRFVAVVGASGSGKSSLVGAGLIPRLQSNGIEGSKDWLIIRFTPGETSDNPFESLVKQLPPETQAAFPDATAHLADKPETILTICSSLLSQKPEWAQVLFFIDQFEETFTIVHERYLQAFVNLLKAIAESPHIRAIVTMRSDFYHRCVDIPVLAELLQDGSYPLGIPGQIALYDMIKRPAERASLEFEEGLAERILHDTGSDAGALALMAYTLDELYHIRGSKGKLTLKNYESLGGVQGAIGKRAEKAFQELDKEAKAMLARVFREMVEVDERGTATRQRATLDRVTTNPASIRLVNAFTQARLLVQDKNIVEVAHEALLRSWSSLADWIGDAQDDLRLLKQVRATAIEWHRQNRRKDYLWSHERLQPVYAMLNRLDVEPEPIVKDFIRPEHERLLDELRDSNTLDYRRQAIADRLAQIGEPAIPTLLDTLHHQDKWVRAAATRSLIQLRQPAIPGLVALLQTADAASAGRIARALVAMGDITLPGLIDALKHANPAGRYAAADALDLMNNIETSSALLDAVQDTDGKVRRAASTALKRQGQHNATIWKEVINRIPDALMADDDWGVRANTAFIIGELRDQTKLNELIIALLNETNDEVRHEAAVALSKIADKKITGDLIAALHNPSAAVRCEVIYVLGEIKDQLAVSPLLEMLNDKNNLVRKEAVLALSKLKHPSSVIPLRGVEANDVSHEVRTAANIALRIMRY